MFESGNNGRMWKNRGDKTYPIGIISHYRMDRKVFARTIGKGYSIQNSKDAEELSHAFHQQFKYMGFCDKACEMLNQLLGENSPFGNVEVLNTELGSRLFRTFVEVNPIVVAEFLCRVLSPLSIDSLKGIDAGR